MRLHYEKIRLEGHMMAHKSFIKSLIQRRRFEICCISAPKQVKGRSDGYCYMYIDGYPYQGSVEASTHEANKKIFERFCSTKQTQFKDGREYKDNRNK